jgi:Tfp pilus assembly protein PilO
VTNPNEAWHLSKSVPITLIFALIVQAAVIVWTVSQMQAEITSSQKDIGALEEKVVKLEQNSNIQAVQLGRIEENLKTMKEMLAQIAVAVNK